MRSRRLLAIAGVAIILLAAGSAGAASGQPPISKPVSPDSLQTVTLITGDQVFMDADGVVRSVVPAAGREDISISINTRDEQTLVLPADAGRLVAKGAVDERLFNITDLVEAGYDDDGRETLPVIITGDDGPRAAAESADVTHELPSIDATSMEVERDAGAAFWDSITDGSEDGQNPADRSVVSGIDKVWLDGRVEASLDESVPQIGAPAAWDAGYDGTGVTVAVVDSGVDTSHPDLDDRVTKSKNFSDADDTSDRLGHGTHVASIVAGGGERYRGVAPGARLLNGKVLDDEGFGSESGVIAGMQWATKQGAQVVNLSLGRHDEPGLDPVEQAIEILSAETGALFVAAAGNDGSAELARVASPGTAPSALSVGAVDKQDEMAEFSAIGPTHDGALKPDITAPGVDITAARADGTDGSGRYATHDGTSMSTPHVAGAAAVLAQQHPGWDGSTIKTVLTGSAVPDADTSAYLQGSGRVDVGRAISQVVTTEPGAVDFGSDNAGHVRPSHELTYRNSGEEPVELALELRAFSADGSPAPEGLFAVEPAEVVVPAGGKASVTVTLDATLDVPKDLYGGTITATDDTGELVTSTAVGAWYPGPQHELTLTFLDDDGLPTADGDAWVTSFDDGFGDTVVPDESGRVTLPVPEGTFHLSANVYSETPEQIKLIKPKFEITHDTEIVLDAREAEPFDIEIPDPAAEPMWSNYNYMVGSGWFLFGSTTFNPSGGPDEIRVAELESPGPARTDPADCVDDHPDCEGADEIFSGITGAWEVETPGGKPHRYHASWESNDELLTGLHEAPADDEFATVDTTFGHTSDQPGWAFAGWDDDTDGYTPIVFEAELPAEVVNHVLGNGVLWWFGAVQGDGIEGQDDLCSDDQDTLVVGDSLEHEYPPGEALSETYNVGVFGPRLAWFGVWRYGDEIDAFVPMFADGAGNDGYSRYEEATTTLSVDGEEVMSVDKPLSDECGGSVGPWTATDAGGRFELTTDVTRPAEVSRVSTRVQATWAFDMGASGEDQGQDFPLSMVRYSPELSAQSTAPADRTFTIPFTIQGAGKGKVDELSFEVSFDEGESWEPVKKQSKGQFQVEHPKKPGSVSLRAHLTDKKGNTLEQTIERAYLTEPGKPEPTQTPSQSPTPPQATPSASPPEELPSTGLASPSWLVAATGLLALGGLMRLLRRSLG